MVYIYIYMFIYMVYIYIYIYIYIIYVYIYISEHKQNAQNTKRWKQSSAIKQLLETVLLAIKMCTDFITDVIWMNTVSLANDLKAVAGAFRAIRRDQR